MTHVTEDADTFMSAWAKEVQFSVVVCDKDGYVLAMNDKACKIFGGSKVGMNIALCHMPSDREKMQKLMETQGTHTYIVERNGQRRLKHQTPWYQNGVYAGFVEVAIDLPAEIPVIVKNSPHIPQHKPQDKT